MVFFNCFSPFGDAAMRVFNRPQGHTRAAMRANIRIKFRKIAFLSLYLSDYTVFRAKRSRKRGFLLLRAAPNDKSRNRHRAPRAGQPQPCRPVRTGSLRSTACRSLRPTSGCVTRCLTLSAAPTPRSYRPRAALSSVPDTEYSGFCIRIEGRLLDTPCAHHGHLANGTRLYNAPPFSGTLRIRSSEEFIGGVRASALPHTEKTAGAQRSLRPDAVVFYQLAFFTPGMRPFDAISRNWIRLMPN